MMLDVEFIICLYPQLCDVEFVVGDLKINAHRIVLAACSPYFSAMFTSKHFHLT